MVMHRAVCSHYISHHLIRVFYSSECQRLDSHVYHLYSRWLLRWRPYLSVSQLYIKQLKNMYLLEESLIVRHKLPLLTTCGECCIVCGLFSLQPGSTGPLSHFTLLRLNLALIVFQDAPDKQCSLLGLALAPCTVTLSPHSSMSSLI